MKPIVSTFSVAVVLDLTDGIEEKAGKPSHGHTLRILLTLNPRKPNAQLKRLDLALERPYRPKNPRSQAEAIHPGEGEKNVF